jgi:4'-phosphopantetheinyl transferase EntD
VIEQLLPACVVAVEARSDDPDVRLFPEEEALVANAVHKRRAEFTTGRACARAALDKLGVPVVSIPTGERGEPLWPAGIVGSITHCQGYRACAAAHKSEVLTLGIDAEPNAALPDGLLGDIARPEELPKLRQLAAQRPEIHWDRLLFSAKESVYKAWFPLAKRWLGFEDAVLEIDLGAGAFCARLLVQGPLLAESGAQEGSRFQGESPGCSEVRRETDGLLLGEGRLSGFSGKWIVQEGIVLTAIAVTIA